MCYEEKTTKWSHWWVLLKVVVLGHVSNVKTNAYSSSFLAHDEPLKTGPWIPCWWAPSNPLSWGRRMHERPTVWEQPVGRGTTLTKCSCFAPEIIPKSSCHCRKPIEWPSGTKSRGIWQFLRDHKMVHKKAWSGLSDGLLITGSARSSKGLIC